MISRLHLSSLLTVAALFGGAILLFNGVSVQLSWLLAVGGTVSGVSLVLLVFDRWIWRWGALHGWFVERPDLRGTWSLGLNSSWHSDDLNPEAEIEAYIVVRQTFWTLSLRTLSAESSSEMLATSIQRSKDGVYELTGIYQSRPRLRVRAKSLIHYGAIALTIEGDPANSMSGHYWTDRKTQGEMASRSRKRQLVHTFDEARQLFSQLPPTAQDLEEEFAKAEPSHGTALPLPPSAEEKSATSQP